LFFFKQKYEGILAIDKKVRKMKSKLILLALFLSTGLFGQFGNPNLIIDGSGAADLALFDVDADGDQDVILVKNDKNFYSGYWYENLDGQGNYGLPIVFDHFRDREDTHIEIADLNGDGLDDIISSTLWLENTGSANGFIEHFYPPGFGGNAFPVDMDNDGDIDILRTPIVKAYISSGQGFFWMENTDGLGNFDHLPIFGDIPGTTSYRGTSLINFDGDAFIDVITGYKDNATSTSGFRVWKNVDGSGTNMELALDVVTSSSTIYEIATGDVDNDGFDEFATIERTQANINNSARAYYYSNNAGVFSASSLLQNLGATYPQVEFVDLENSGTESLVILDDGADKYYQFSPTNSVDLFTGKTAPGSGGIGDFGDVDNDGKIDLVETSFIQTNTTSNSGDLFVSPSIVDGIGNDPTEFVYHIRAPRSEKMYDWDGSGSPDFVSLEGGAEDKELVWKSNDGSGNFATKEILIEDFGEAYDFQIVDFNQDGLDDVLLFDWRAEVYAYTRNIDGTLTEQSDPLLDGLVMELLVGDLDGDGFGDYLFYDAFDANLSWKKNNGNLTGEKFVLDDNIQSSIRGLEIADLNNDGLAEVILSLFDGSCYVYYNLGGGNFGSATLVGTISTNIIEFRGAHDINKDGMVDLIFESESAVNVFSEKLSAFFQTSSNAFGEESILLDESIVGEMYLTDLDGDDDLDIYTKKGLAINVSGFGDFFYTQNSTADWIFGEVIDASRDVDGDSRPDVVWRYYSILWAKNELNGEAVISGKIVIDDNQNCIEDNNESYLGNVLVRVEGPATTYYSNSSLQGYYGTLTPTLGDYTLEAIPPSPYWSVCELDTTIAVNDPDSDYNVDFHFQTEVDCPLLAPSISVTRIRPCLPGRIILNFCNYGTIDSDVSYAEVVIPNGVIVDGTTHPIFSQTGNKITFELEPIAPGVCEGIFIDITTDCSILQVGDIVCPEVNVTPDDICMPINIDWDGSTIEATGACIGDSAVFTLRNIGDGAMDMPREFRVEIINDDIIMMLIDTFELDPLEEKRIAIANVDQNASRIEADQDMDHPNANPAAAIVQNCLGLADNWPGILNSFPQYNGDPFNDVICQTITGSFDPNEKVTFPVGYGDEHYIERDWPIDYRIYFQNTGNDTAFTVRIEDQISELLDLGTLRVSNGSHPFTWEITPQNKLIFNFENILLPDSTIDLVGSQGFVEYTIKPKSGAGFNLKIENTAEIYFDFNEPIITNTTFHTIRKPVFASANYLTLCTGDEFENNIITQDTIIEQLTEFMDYNELVFNHISVNESYLIEEYVSVYSGDVVQGVLINADTTLFNTTLTSEGCDSTVQTIVSVIISGTAEHSFAQSLSLYPNPAEGHLSLQWDGWKVANLELFDVAGKFIKHENAPNYTLEMNVIDLSPGVYYLRFSGEFGQVTKRFAKL